MSLSKYYPLIKTRDAELSCFKNLGKEVLDNIVPVFELTKSRKTSIVPDGDVNRRMKQIEEIMGEREFILDLSTEESYLNPQIEQLLNQSDGFLDWYYFVFENYAQLSIIPMIHIYEDESGVGSEVIRFVKAAAEKCEKLAVRLPYDLPQADLESYVKPIIEALGDNAKLIVLLDGNFLRPKGSDEFEQITGTFQDSLDALNPYLSYLLDIVVLSTSFPSSVVSVTGEDAEGDFDVFEERIFAELKQEYPHITYGDYVSINTEQIEIRGGTFVPRIDILFDHGNRFFYKRYRRDKGSYPLCAQKVIADNRYKNLNTWADDQITLAEQGNPTGISPSFWITVRMNYYITAKLNLRLDEQ